MKNKFENENKNANIWWRSPPSSNPIIFPFAFSHVLKFSFSFSYLFSFKIIRFDGGGDIIEVMEVMEVMVMDMDHLVCFYICSIFQFETRLMFIMQLV